MMITQKQFSCMSSNVNYGTLHLNYVPFILEPLSYVNNTPSMYPTSGPILEATCLIYSGIVDAGSQRLARHQ